MRVARFSFNPRRTAIESPDLDNFQKKLYT
jgi:hypothetical protein